MDVDLIERLLQPIAHLPYVPSLIVLAALSIAAFVGSWVTRKILLRVVTRVAEASPVQWDDLLIEHGVLTRLAHVVPALIVYVGVDAVPILSDDVVRVVGNVALSYVVLTVALAAGRLLNALNGLYETRAAERARQRPIKGYLQLAKLLLFIVSAVLVIAILIERSPLLLLSGLGAMTAVLMLVFKDTILSLVAAVQLSSHDMLRVGDWIEMPALNADGDVIDIALHTVKVQNWDKTITTIPTHRLISESFKNWRGMQESGGRRIKRSLLIDQASVRFLGPAEIRRMRRFMLLDDYLDGKQRELDEHNAALEAAGKDPINSRRVTNIGTFRAYVAAYLRAHPGVNQDMTMMVRQLAPGPTGLPLEIYCFTATIKWVPYEGIQADIFDHLLALLPEFDLRLFQQPGGSDIMRALEPLADATTAPRKALPKAKQEQPTAPS